MYNSECYDVVNLSIKWVLISGLSCVVVGVGLSLLVDKLRRSRGEEEQKKLGVLGVMVVGGFLSVIPFVGLVIVNYAYPAHSLYWIVNGSDVSGSVEINGAAHDVSAHQWICVKERGYEERDQVKATHGGTEVVDEDVDRGKYVINLSNDWTVGIASRTYGSAELQHWNDAAARETGFSPFGPSDSQHGAGLHHVSGEDGIVYGIEESLPDKMSQSSSGPTIAHKISLKK